MQDASSETAAPASAGVAVVRIPLRDKQGEVREYALTDEADAALVQQHRWFCNSDGYAARNQSTDERWPSGKVKQRTILMSRVIMGLDFGDKREADHISRDKLDNRRSNLRITTHAQNMQNRSRRGGSSKYRGVSFKKGAKKRPWIAYVCVMGKMNYLGAFADEDEAGAAAAAGRAEHMPFSEDAAVRERA